MFLHVYLTFVRTFTAPSAPLGKRCPISFRDSGHVDINVCPEVPFERLDEHYSLIPKRKGAPYL